MNFLRLYIFLIVVSCNTQNRNTELLISVYPCLYYDSIEKKEQFLICNVIENKSDFKIYTFQPQLVIYNAEKFFNYTSYYTDWGNEAGFRQYSLLNAVSFFESDSNLKNQIATKKDTPFDIYIPHNLQAIDSFVSFRYHKANRQKKMDYLDSMLGRHTWLFMEPHSIQKKYYIVKNDFFYEQNTTLKIRTVHPFEKANHRKPHETPKFPLPDEFMEYQLFDKEVKIDSLLIHIIVR